MSRRALSYPLLRSLDTEAGGAADLQTDIMRFMAILALCLMAIFALVQSLPAMPPQAASLDVVEPAPPPPVKQLPVEESPVEENRVDEPIPTPPIAAPEPVPERLQARLADSPAPAKATPPAERPVVLTRPAPQPRRAKREANPTPPVMPVETPAPPPPAAAQNQGFTLRFESDLALSRLVATGQVGFFALQDGTARRMSVSQSRSSFWAAPTPPSYHEMDAATVPAGVRSALARSGWREPEVAWGVTLPPRMSSELARLMREYDGGALIIAKDGTLSRAAE